ncbi:MAG: RNA polymerase sigma factor [Planctomycetaceae bacterium]
MAADEAIRLLVARIRSGDKNAWADCIAQFEGRLLAYVDSRLRDRAASEDVVQETFLGFLVGLPNYDDRTPLESFLFAIAAHKLTDALRRMGRRPALPWLAGESSAGLWEPAGRERAASSVARSGERQHRERQALHDALTTLISQWQAAGEFERLKCIELLFVLGWSNKQVARALSLSEQAVANHKHFAVAKLRDLVSRARPAAAAVPWRTPAPEA